MSQPIAQGQGLLISLFCIAVIIAGLAATQYVYRRRNRVPPKDINVADAFTQMMHEQDSVAFQKKVEELMIADWNKEIFDIRHKYKYTQEIRRYNDGKRINYCCIYADEDLLPNYAMVYYKGSSTMFYRHQDGDYNFENENWVPADIVEGLKPFLTDINLTIKEFNLMENPNDPFWNLQTLFALQNEQCDRQDMASGIDLIFFCWYFITEQQRIDPLFDNYYLNDQLDDWHEYEFLTDPLYLFITGWMLNHSPGLFYASAGEGKSKMLLAHELQPANPLYKWGNSDHLNLTREETRALAAQVDEAQFDGLAPFVKEYFMAMARGDAQL